MLAGTPDLLALRRAEPGLQAARAADGPTAGGLVVTLSDTGLHDGRPRWLSLARPGWRTVVNLGDEDVVVGLGDEVVTADIALAWRGDAAVGTASGGALSVRLGQRSAAVVRVGGADA